MTLKLLLNPKRANRLVQQKVINESGFGLDKVLEELNTTVFNAKKGSSYETEIIKSIQSVTLTRLMNLAASTAATAEVKSQVNAMLEKLASNFAKNGDDFSKQLGREIAAFREHPENFKVIESAKIPDGSPIGSFECYYD